MKEFSFDVSAEDLGKGLFPSARVPVNSKRLEMCLNMRPFEGGLEEFGIPTNAVLVTQFTGMGEAFNWPFPQIYFGKEHVLSGGEHGIYEVNTVPAVGSWTLARLCTTPAYGTWQYADMGRLWIATNAGRVVWYDGTTANVSTKVVQACCFSRGRVLMGGFTASTTYGHWGNALYPNSVAWSSIGAGDAFWPFQTTAINADLLLEVHNRNEFGFATLPTPGTVMAMLPIRKLGSPGEAVIVYTDQSVFLLDPVSAPLSTFGALQLAPVGIVSRAAVVGDLNEHHFVSGDGSLWSVTPERGAVKLGYEHLFSQMSAQYQNVSAILDPMKNDRYFAVNAFCFVVTPTGVAQNGYYHSALGRWKGELVGQTRKGANGDYAIVKVGRTNFGFPGIKTVQQISASYSSMTSAQANVSYRYDAGAFSDSGYKNLNSQGVAFPIVTANEFKCAIKGNADSGRHIDSIRMTWKSPDKRFVRGV